MARQIPGTGSLAVLVVFATACVDDVKPPLGTLRMVQATGRPGAEEDALGVLVVGQSVCGTHVFFRSEGGTHAHLGGEKVTQSCLALPRFKDLRGFELSNYPKSTVSTLHAQLLLDPSACAAPSETCGELCSGIEAPKDAETPGSDGTCPASWIPLDQSTLVISTVLDDAATESDSGSGTGTGSSTATSTDAESGSTADAGTTTGTGGSTSETSGDASTT